MKLRNPIPVLVLVLVLATSGCTAPSTSGLSNLHANMAVNYGGLYGPISGVVLAPMPGQTASYDFKNQIYTVSWVGTNLPSTYATTNSLQLPQK